MTSIDLVKEFREELIAQLPSWQFSPVAEPKLRVRAAGFDIAQLMFDFKSGKVMIWEMVESCLATYDLRWKATVEFADPLMLEKIVAILRGIFMNGLTG